MPRSLQHIIDHADELADKFEAYEPSPDDHRDPAVLVSLRQAVTHRLESEREVLDAVEQARTEGYTWSAIGALLGTSGEAARQRYGRPVSH
jgi:hypothetical protein